MIKLLLLIIFCGLFLFVPPANAQVVINELYSWETSGDWVELYAFEDTDISGWILRDTATTAVKKIPEATTIGPSGSPFYVVEVGNRLNRDGDIIKLFKNDDSTLVDQISYGDKGGVCAPSSGQSAGRYPDANLTIERFRSPTKGSTNNSAELDPCPTPSPEPSLTPVPTPIPSPTPRPTATLKPTPTAKPTNAVSETKIPTSRPTLKSKEVSSAPIEAVSEDNSLGVMGVQDVSNKIDEPVTKVEVEGGQTRNFPWQAGLMILFGLILVSAAIYPFFKKFKKGYNQNSDQQDKL